MVPDLGLTDAVAVVTGFRGRLGPVWSAGLATAGATVVGIDIQSGHLAPDSGITAVYQADVADAEGLRATAGSIVREHGIPSVLVNNAGIDQPPDSAARTFAPEDVPLDDFRRTVDVNLVGAFNAIQAFGAPMRDVGRGSIVNIGSLYASIAPEPGFYDHMTVDPPFLKPAAYGASKAGVLALTRYFARLWGRAGVRVNTLSPGGVRGGQDPTFTAKYCARVPLQRMAEPEDLVGPLVFLASDASSYVTGHELRVDGGFTA